MELLERVWKKWPMLLGKWRRWLLQWRRKIIFPKFSCWCSIVCGICRLAVCVTIANICNWYNDAMASKRTSKSSRGDAYTVKKRWGNFATVAFRWTCAVHLVWQLCIFEKLILLLQSKWCTRKIRHFIYCFENIRWNQQNCYCKQQHLITFKDAFPDAQVY